MKRFIVCLVVTFQVMLPQFCGAQEQEKPFEKKARLKSSEFDGTWKGIGHQFDTSTSWDIEIILKPDNYKIRYSAHHGINYPALGCGGELELISEDENFIVFSEKLEYGARRCINFGKTVLAKPENNSIKYFWYYPNGVKGAKGKLFYCQTQNDCAAGF